MDSRVPGAVAPGDVRSTIRRLEQHAWATFEAFYDDQVEWIDAHLADVTKARAAREREESSAQVAKLIQTPSRQRAAHERRSPAKAASRPPIRPLSYAFDREDGAHTTSDLVPARMPVPERTMAQVRAPAAARDVFGSPAHVTSSISRMRSPPPRAASPPVKTLLPAIDLATTSPGVARAVPLHSGGDLDEMGDVLSALISPRVAGLAATRDDNLSIISEGTEPDDNPLKQSRILSESRMASATALAPLASPPALMPSHGSLTRLPPAPSPLKQSTTATHHSSPVVDLQPALPTASTGDSVQPVGGGPQMLPQQMQTRSDGTHDETTAQVAPSTGPVVQPGSPPSRLPTPVSPRAAAGTTRPLSPRPQSPRPHSPRPLSPPLSPRFGHPIESKPLASPLRTARSFEVPLRESPSTNYTNNRSLHRTPTSALFSSASGTLTAGKRLSGGGLPLPPSPTSTFLTNHITRTSTFQFGALLNRERDIQAVPTKGPKSTRPSFLATATAAAAAAAAGQPDAGLPRDAPARLSLKRKSSADHVEHTAKLSRTRESKITSPLTTHRATENRVESLKNRLEKMSRTTSTFALGRPSATVASASTVVSVASATVPDASAISPQSTPRRRSRRASTPRAATPSRQPARRSTPLRLDEQRDAVPQEPEESVTIIVPTPAATTELPLIDLESHDGSSPQRQTERAESPGPRTPAFPGSFAFAESTVHLDELAKPLTPTANPAIMHTTTPPFSPPPRSVPTSVADIAIDNDADCEMGDDTEPDLVANMTMVENEPEFVLDRDSRLQSLLFDGDLTAETSAFPRPPVAQQRVSSSTGRQSTAVKAKVSSASIISLADSSSLAPSTSLASSATGLISSIFSKSFGAKPKPEIKSLQAAKEARERERIEQERKQKEKDERRRQMEEQRRQREMTGAAPVENKRKDREGPAILANQMSKSKPPVRPKTPVLEDEPAKRRKIEAEAAPAPKAADARPAEIAAASRPTSALSQSSASQLRIVGGVSKPPAAPVANAPQLNKPKLPNSVSATGSSLIGHKYMPDPATLRTNATQTTSASTSKSQAAPPSATKPLAVKPAVGKMTVSQASRASSKSALSQSRVSIKILQQAAAEAEEHIELPDIDSEYSDPEDHAGHAKRDAARVEWAQSPQMRAALKLQENFNPDTLFGRVESTVDLEAIFAGANTRPSRIRPRSSSAVWNHDRLTEAEKEEYNRKRYGIV